jgi:hypothetical protein
MDRDQFEMLSEGNIVRHVSGGESHIVVRNYKTRVTAVHIADMTNPEEWVIVWKQHPKESEPKRSNAHIRPV